MVDILGILGSLKGKVLDASHYDLLEHAYKLQQENVTQLRENNAALRESADLLRAELGRAKDRVVALERENTELQTRVLASGPESELSTCALALLRWLVGDDLKAFYDVEAHDAELGSKLETEAAIDELEAAKLIDVGSYGSQGAHYYLTDAGKRFVLTLSIP